MLKVFNSHDQIEFAHLSGDRNPLHLDPLLARRTQLGACVVHGMHTVLWALEQICRVRALDRPVLLRARFINPILVGDEAMLRIVSDGDAALRSEVMVNRSICLTLTLRWSGNHPESGETDKPAPADSAWPTDPIELDIDEVAAQAGTLGFASTPDAAGAAFPALRDAIGATQIAALACVSRLVGMVCPGLHSILAGADLTLSSRTPPQAHIEYRALDADPRTRSVVLAITGGGVTGTIYTFARHPPVQQPAARELRSLLNHEALAGTVSLIVGGSRGVGEVASKIIAGSGGRVIVTYATGRTDAERVADEISAGGGAAETYALDVRRPLAGQLAGLPAAPTHIYYFATSQIFGRRTHVFDESVFADFLRFYVTGFWELCQFFAEGGGNSRIFYPSSTAVADRPRAMTEYAMAKAAGEQLCADISRFMRGTTVVMRRLPRILTDQTATVATVMAYDVVKVMLPAIREMVGQTSP